MKLKQLIPLAFFMPFQLFSQNVGINSTGANPDASSMLDIVSTDKGILIPRVVLTGTASALPIVSPTTSLLIYNSATVSDVTPGYYYWDGSAWIRVLDSGLNSDHDWYEVGGTTAPNSINDNLFTQGNVGIGLNNPSERLEIESSSNILTTKLINSSGSTGSEARIDFQMNNANVMHGARIGVIRRGANSRSDMYFSTSNNGGGAPLERMRITKDGDVGIGTTTPITKLSIEGGLTRINSRGNNQHYPISHSQGEEVFAIDPTISEAELQKVFSSTNVTWVNDNTAPVDIVFI